MSTQAHQKLALLQEGIASALSGDKTAARQLLEQVTTAHPENELAWLWLASVCTEPIETIRCWRRVLKLNPTQEHALTGLRRLLLQEGINAAKAGRKEEARELLLELTQIDNHSEVALLWLATVAKDADEATQYTARVLELNPSNERARAWLEKLQGSSQTYMAAATAAAPAPTDSYVAKNSAGAIRVISSSGWSCPLCGAETIKTVAKCPQCRAVVSLTNIEELLHNQDVNVPLVREAVRRLEDQADAAKDNVDYFTLYNLGIACLNLNRLDEGANYLRSATKLKLKDERLKTQVEALLQRVHQSAHGAATVMATTDSVEAAEPEKIEAPTENTGAHTILVVDDSPTIRKLVSMTLEKYGHRVICATDGLDAVNKLKETVPDLILSDITMPHMDGYQLCKAIRGNAVTKKVPVIMLSGKDGIFDKLRGRMVGATAYITKPFDADSLLQLIDMHCQQER